MYERFVLGCFPRVHYVYRGLILHRVHPWRLRGRYYTVGCGSREITGTTSKSIIKPGDKGVRDDDVAVDTEDAGGCRTKKVARTTVDIPETKTTSY